jgi:RimJ/RimL family protein N-acetyltransferase
VIVTETARLRLREFELHDVRALKKILSAPNVMEFSSKGPLSEADTLGFIDWCIKSYQEYGYGQWAVIEKGSGKLIGCCGLSHATVDEVDEVEIGYRLDKEHWGKGLATEAAGGVLAHGFDALMLESIAGIVAPRHSRSIRVLEKIGFRTFSETRYCGWDVRVYRLSRGDR